MGLFSEDLTERTQRFGCIGSAVMVAAGIGLIGWGVKMIMTSESNWIGWIMIAAGVVLSFIGGGFNVLGWIWWP